MEEKTGNFIKITNLRSVKYTVFRVESKGEYILQRHFW